MMPQRPTAVGCMRWFGGQCLPTTGRLGELDPSVHRDTRDDLTNGIECQIACRLEANTRLAHVELLTRRLEAVRQASRERAITVDGHQVQRQVRLLRRQRYVPQRVSVVGVSVPDEGHLLHQHALADGLLVSRGKVPLNLSPYALDFWSSIGGELCEELLNGRARGLWSHGYESVVSSSWSAELVIQRRSGDLGQLHTSSLCSLTPARDHHVLCCRGQDSTGSVSQVTAPTTGGRTCAIGQGHATQILPGRRHWLSKSHQNQNGITFAPCTGMTNTPATPKLLDQVRQACRLRHFSRRTEDAYTHWTRRFVLHQGKRHPATLGATEVTAFLAHLADERHVSASTQNQALCALYCFCIAASSASPCPIDSNCRKLDERHTCWRWLRHSHGPGTARPRRRQHDDDLHPRAEPRRTRRPEPGR